MPDLLQRSAATAARPTSSHRRGALLFVVGAMMTISFLVLADFAHQAGALEVVARAIAANVPPGPWIEMSRSAGTFSVTEPERLNSVGIIAEIGLLGLVLVPVLLVVVALWHIAGLTMVVVLHRQWGKPSYQSAIGSTWITDGTGLLVLGQTAVAAALWFPLAYAMRFVWWEAFHLPDDAGNAALYISDGAIAASWAGAMLLTMLAASRAWRAAVLARVQPEQMRCGVCDYIVGTTRGRCPECGTMDSGVARFALFRTRWVQRIACSMAVLIAASLYCAPLTLTIGMRVYWIAWIALKGGSLAP